MLPSQGKRGESWPSSTCSEKKGKGFTNCGDLRGKGEGDCEEKKESEVRPPERDP